MQIAIIGSGFGGLALAGLLSKDGHKVTVFEKNEQVGGRASVVKENGFEFHLGPSWYLMPEVFEDLFSRFGKKTSDFYTLQRLNPSYRIFFQDEYIDISEDFNKNVDTFEKIEKNAGRKFSEYVKKTKKIYYEAMKNFVYKDYPNFYSNMNIRSLLMILENGLFENMEDYIGKYFQNEKIRKILYYTCVFLGSQPKDTPAIYSILSYVDFGLGVYYPKGGLGKVKDSIYEIGKSLGVEYLLDEEVTKIIVKNGKCTGLVSNKNSYNFDLVVANADYPHVELDLIEKQYRNYDKNYWSKKKIGPSGFIIHLGLNKKINGLSHHNIFYANDSKENFRKIFEKKEWSISPSYYVCVPSLSDNEIAPKDCENLFIFVPIAAGLKGNDEWNEFYYNKILEDLENKSKEKIREHVIVKKLFTTKDFESRYNAYLGTALGLAHTLFQTGGFRPKAKSNKISNLYYTGQYTHPGVGVPISIISAIITHEKIKNEQQ